MDPSRRSFMAVGGAAALGVPLALAGNATADPVIPAVPPAAPEPPASAPTIATAGPRVLHLFSGLPGRATVKFYAPPANGDQGLTITQQSARRFFVGSAIKTFVLAETMRQNDTPDVITTLSNRQLNLNSDVWNLDSATFNPPELIGRVSHRTALEAMINHSDNTATDMSIKQAGIDNIRSFISSIGLTNTLLPDSTRSFFGYLVGAKDYKTFTWDELQAAANDPIVNPPLNTVETLASSADDMVSYYSRALTGEFFTNPLTLTEFRRILSFGDAIYLAGLPLGVSAFVKGGSIDVPGYHALCVPGGMYFDDRWVFFCMALNWDAAAETDPATVTAFITAVSKATAVVKQALQRS